MNRIDAIRHQHREQEPERFGTKLVRSQASYDIPGDMERSRRRQSSVVRIWSAVKHHLGRHDVEL